MGWLAACSTPQIPTTKESTPVPGYGELREINNRVNKTRVYFHDGVHRNPRFLPEGGEGDCRDYSYTKKLLAIQAGWPKDRIGISIGYNGESIPHAVAVIDQTYILDIYTDLVLPWTHTDFCPRIIETPEGWFNTGLPCVEKHKAVNVRPRI